MLSLDFSVFLANYVVLDLKLSARTQLGAR